VKIFFNNFQPLINKIYLSGWWLGFGCGWAKLNVVFLCQQVNWQNTSFNFAEALMFYCSLSARMLIVGRSFYNEA